MTERSINLSELLKLVERVVRFKIGNEKKTSAIFEAKHKYIACNSSIPLIKGKRGIGLRDSKLNKRDENGAAGRRVKSHHHQQPI